jgi:hypothetical protein
MDDGKFEQCFLLSPVSFAIIFPSKGSTMGLAHFQPLMKTSGNQSPVPSESTSSIASNASFIPMHYLVVAPHHENEHCLGEFAPMRAETIDPPYSDQSE